MSGVYREIVAPERIVFTFAWDDEHGRPGDETLITVTFEEVGNEDPPDLRQEPFASVESRDSHAAGWAECLDRMQAYPGGCCEAARRGSGRRAVATDRR